MYRVMSSRQPRTTAWEIDKDFSQDTEKPDQNNGQAPSGDNTQAPDQNMGQAPSGGNTQTPGTAMEQPGKKSDEDAMKEGNAKPEIPTGVITEGEGFNL